MHLELIESFSIPSDPKKPNEDSFAVGARAAAVFDGATGLGERLMPGPSDAAWIAQFGARRFRAHADSGAKDAQGDIRDWLRGAAADAEKSFHALRRRPPLEKYEIACASAIMVAPKDDDLDVLWFGDCAALLHTQKGFVLLGDTMDRRESERARVEALSKATGRAPAAPGVRDEFLPALRAARNRINAGGDWLFSPDANCADHAKHARVTPAPPSPMHKSHLLLASDGFLALASDYDRYTPEGLLAACEERGLAALGEELRAVEASDPDGVKFPRFKRSDDATALLLAFAR